MAERIAGFWEFLAAHFDKLILFAMVIVANAIVLFCVTRGFSLKTIVWAQTSLSAVQGALIALLTGRKAAAEKQPNS